MMNRTFSILFWLQKHKISSKTGEAPISCRVTVDGRRVEISTGKKTLPEKWNANGDKVKGSGNDARLINDYLVKMKNRIIKIHDKLEEADQYISAEIIKDTFLGKTSGQYSLLELFEYHNDQMKAQIGKEFALATYTRYETTLSHIRDFIKHQYKREDFLLQDLKYPFIADFEFYLKTVRNCNHNSTLKYIRNFRKIINLAIKNEWMDKDPFARYQAKLKEVKRDYLTKEELQALEEKEFSIDRLDQVRDIFVFCCYTGLAYTDVEKLTPENISKGLDGEYWIFVDRTKTGNPSNVPLLPKAADIINKYENHPITTNFGKLLPVISNQKMNAYLKEICILCEINKNITSHIARHTFATTVTLANGVSIETVSSMLGHSNLRTTQIYAKVVQEKVSEDMAALKKKLDKTTVSRDVQSIARNL